MIIEFTDRTWNQLTDQQQVLVALAATGAWTRPRPGIRAVPVTDDQAVWLMLQGTAPDDCQ